MITAVRASEDLFDYVTVTNLLVDGDVEVDFGDGNVQSLPALDSYRDREVGQTVRIQKDSELEWFVMGPVGGPDRTPPPVELPPTVTLQWGPGNPTGTGWAQSATTGIWVRDDGQGNRTLWVAMPPVAPAPSRKPREIVVPATNVQSWRGGSIDGKYGAPVQGYHQSAAQYGFWSGGWGFPDLVSKLSGSTVTNLYFEVGRSSNSHGISGNAPLHLWLATSPTFGDSPPARAYEWVESDADGKPLVMSRGTRTRFRFPDAMKAQLLSGAYLSVIAYDTGTGSNYIIYTPDASIVASVS